METLTAQRFEERLVQIYNNAALTLMISIGHRTGLFDIMSEMPASRVSAIARKSQLSERYVREWLNALTVGGIIDYEPESKKYVLPEERARWLTRKSAKDNLAVFSQYVGILADVEDDIVECFKKGGGVPYSSFARFHEVMAEDSGQSLVPALLDSVLLIVDGLTHKLTKGIDVLDIGCGRGLALMKMAGAFPQSRFVGYDFSKEAISFATENAKNAGLNNITFEAVDVTKVSDVERFDFITAFDAIHDQAQPQTVLNNIFRALKSDGIFLMQDIDASSHVENNMDHPLGPFLYTISCMHCMTVSLALDGEGLGTMWGRETAREYLQKSGFKKVDIHKLEHDIQNCIYLVSK